MRKILFIISVLLFIPRLAFGALDADTVWEFRSSATANMLNGGGFNSTNATPGTDYSQQDTAHLTITDLVIGADNTTVTSILTPFDTLDNGNILHITAGTNFTQGWYEVVSVTGVIATLDRACGTATSTGGTAYLGGSLNVGGSLEDNFFDICVTGNIIYFMGAVTYTLSEGITDAVTRTVKEGYLAIRGDNPTGTDRPTIACGANVVTFSGSTRCVFRNLIFTTTEANGVGIGSQALVENCKVLNSSTTADRHAMITANVQTTILNCEVGCTKGRALKIASSNYVMGCYLYGGSAAGGISLWAQNANYETIINNIISVPNAATSGINIGGGVCNFIVGNTIYGAETPQGTGVSTSAGSQHIIYNNIFYGLTTGYSGGSATTDVADYNDFFNCTTARTNLNVGDHDIAVDPSFTSASTGDFTLQSGSPCLATGFPQSMPGATGDYQYNIGVDQDDNTAAGGGGGGASFWINS